MSRATFWIGVLAGAGMLATLALTLFSPEIYYPIGSRLEACPACRIFYVHVPSAWIAYLAFFVVFIGSIAYLRSGVERWDVLAKASAEIGVVMTTLTLITGSLWGRPIWGTWWSWDARMTTTLILWFIYVAYLLLRSYISDERREARFAAVLGIVGFIDVPINYLSVTLWRTLHPEITIARPEGPNMPAFMVQILMFSLLSFSLLYIYLLRERMRLEYLAREVGRLRLRAPADSQPASV